MKNKDLIIGVLGGMGTYATINLFRQYADIFPAEREDDRPRIIIDNRCTMPSRVRAYLYGERTNQLIDEMTESIKYLITMGGKNVRILLACNTSHLFLPKVYERIPEAKSHIVNIIDICEEYLTSSDVKSVSLVASEATIDSRVYHNILEKNGISCKSPTSDQYCLIRECIEAVKQNKFSEEVKNIFLNFVSCDSTVILGCTELPVLYDMYKDEIKNKNVIDPLYLSLLKISKEYHNA